MKKYFLITLCVSCILTDYAQTNFYVSPTGNNSNNGSITTPWQTIQYSLNNMPSNSVLNIAPGTYNERISIPSDNITLKNQSSSLPEIDATGITSQDAIISVYDKNNITIDGLILKNNIENYAKGIIVEGACNQVTIKNCIIHDIHFSSNVNAPITDTTNAQGIIVFGSNATTAITNLVIENNELYNCRLGFSEGIAVNGNVDGFIIASNYVHAITNIGIDVVGHEGTCSNPILDQARNGRIQRNKLHDCLSPYATSGGIYIDGGKNVIIEYNESFHNGYGIEIGCENIGKTTDAITVKNNFFYDNQVCGIAVGGFDYPTGSGKVINAKITNNTCYFNDFSNSGIGELYLSYSENTLIENNIFHTNAQDAMVFAELNQPQLNFNYNVFYCPAGVSAMTADWNGSFSTGFVSFVNSTSTNSFSVFTNPSFVTPAINNPDFHLLSTSLAKDAGNPSYVPELNETDFFSELRIENTVVDCGADEYGTNSNSIIEESTNLSMFPNPAKEQLTIETESPQIEVFIYDINGKLLLFSQEKVVDLKGLESGIYTVNVYDGTKYFIKKLLKTE